MLYISKNYERENVNTGRLFGGRLENGGVLYTPKSDNKSTS
jgi:hypothetical protein